MEHPVVPPVATSLEELGMCIAQLRYDAMLVVLYAFKAELQRQQCADGKKQRFMLSHHGVRACSATEELMRTVGKMWDISIPYMEADLKERPPRINSRHTPRKHT